MAHKLDSSSHINRIELGCNENLQRLLARDSTSILGVVAGPEVPKKFKDRFQEICLDYIRFEFSEKLQLPKF